MFFNIFLFPPILLINIYYLQKMMMMLLTLIIQNKYFKSSITVFELFELLHTTLDCSEKMVT